MKPAAGYSPGMPSIPSAPATPRRYQPGLRFWLTVVYGLISLALGAVLAIGIEHQAAGVVEAEVGERLALKARGLAGRLDDGIAERRADARVLAATREVREADREDARALFDRLREATPELAWIGLTDAEGRVLAASGGLLEGQDVSARPWFIEGRRGEFLGDVHEAVLLASLLGAPGEDPPRFVDVALPLHGADGRLRGVLGLHLSWSWAARLRDALDREDGGAGVVRILGARGEVLLGPPRAQVAPMTGEASGWRRVEGEAPAVLATARARIAAPRGGLDWTVEVEQPERIAFAGLHDLRRGVLLGSALPVLLSILAAAMLARVIGAPLRRLASAATRYHRGDARVRIPEVGGYREARQLGEAVDGLVRELSEFAMELELRVLERTEALGEANARLEQLAVTDPLTGLANRRHFTARLEAQLQHLRQHPAPLALLLVDLDHFKAINDTHGHPAGDFVLRAVADLLQESVRGEDAVARIGGEEFALLLPGADADAALAKARDLRTRLAARMPLVWEGAPIAPTASIGIALHDADAGDGDGAATIAASLYARADAALYAAKRDGRDRAVLG